MKIIVAGQLIEYKDAGSGKVLLMLHGWGTNLTTFDQLAARLSKNFRVIRFDFPGFGSSPKPNNDWTVDDYAKLTGELVRKLQIKQLHAVIGHSFGGRVIIKGISQGYLTPQKVVLMGAAGVKPKNTLKKAVYKSIAKTGKLITSAPVVNRLQPLLRRKLYNSAGSTDYLNANQMKKTFLNVVNEDLLPLVHTIQRPTLLIWGENDLETPVADAKLMVERMDKGKLEVISGAGHFVYSDDSEKVVLKLDEFL